MSAPILSVREIQKQDIDSIVQYWMSAEPEFLLGMGVDLRKVPSKEEWEKSFLEHVSLPIEKKRSYYLIWEVDGQAVGHSNINKIIIGEGASMHLHLWHADKRIKGMGSTLVKMGLSYYFNNYKLKTLHCEPAAMNPAPNKTLARVGFTFVKKYTTIPSTICAELEVNRWELSYEDFKKMK